MKVLGDIRRQAVHLDSSKYKVMVVWDPFQSRDIGWLTVLKNIEVNLANLQVRDVNLTAFVSSKSLADSSSSAVMGRSEIVSEEAMRETSFSSNMTNLSQDVICVSGDSMEEDFFEYPAMDFNKNVVNIKSEQGVQFPNTSKQNWGRKVGVKRQCPQCYLQVFHRDFLKHLRSVHGVETGSEVICDICDIPVSKYNLEFHKATAHAPKARKAPVGFKFVCYCGKKYSTASGLNQHKTRYCGKEGLEFGGLGRVNELRRNNSLVAQQGAYESARRSNDQRMDNENSSVGGTVTDTTKDTSLNVSSEKVKEVREEKVKFRINYQNSSYILTRSKDRTIKQNLKKFCKEIAGKELRFELNGKALTGDEVAKDFDGAVIFAVVQ